MIIKNFRAFSQLISLVSRESQTARLNGPKQRKLCALQPKFLLLLPPPTPRNQKKDHLNKCAQNQALRENLNYNAKQQFFWKWVWGCFFLLLLLLLHSFPLFHSSLPSLLPQSNGFIALFLQFVCNFCLVYYFFVPSLTFPIH